MSEATQEGASVEDRFESFLSQPEAIQETQEVEPVTEDEVAADQEDVIDQEVEAETSEAKPEEESQPDDQDTESDEEDTTADEEVSEDSLELEDFAKLLGVEADKLDLDEDGQPVFKTKIDGVEGRVKVNDLLKSYQLEGHLNNKNMEVVEKSKQIDEFIKTANQNVSSKLQQLDGALNLANQQLINDFNQIDWKSLETQDPNSYVVKRQQFADRQAQIQQSLGVLQQEQEQARAQQQQALTQRVQQEKQSLFNKVPEWNTEESWQKGNADIREGLSKTYGLEEHILNDIVDHRFVLIARDALKYKKLQDGKPNVLNKVKKAPKVSKSSAPKGKPAQSEKNLRLMKTIKDSGGKHGIEALLMDRNLV